jgi:hypothetical protein
MWRNWWNDNWREKPKNTEKTCSSVTVFTPTLTCLDLASNSGHRGGKLTTSRLNYGTVLGPYVFNYDINRKSKKTELFIHLIKHYVTMMYWGVEVQLHTILISTLDGVVSFMSRLLYPWENISWNPLYRGCLGARAGLDAKEKCSCRKSNTDSSAIEPLA